ncbi:DUF992 domain-containing protein [Bradyrhizobium cenepequi]|uniref:DUF992 domain-containing protein n=1 Tax=Bradyrhizobium cenepequi TaxID=2821403 RepID=UPI001CE2FE3D|nr:DUF992 domain-containing protein [Bradyrhizobium cenepequi]MCA6107063.1 DUF992 domain-containing protein [Bradyrhizobium cenepequi]
MQTIRLLGALCISALISTTASPAQAEAFRVGRLLCSSSPRIGFLVGSTQSLRCVFYRQGSSQRYIYAGRIRRVGLDLGVTGSGVLSWAVFAKNSRIGPGTMRGSYVGASANVALGPGFGANVLIGGSRRSVVLQPISVERAIGVNLAATVTHLTLGARGRR